VPESRIGWRSRRLLLASLCLFLGLLPPAAGGGPAPPPVPPSGLVAEDVDEDAGRAIALTWRLSPDDTAGDTLVTGYYLERATSPSGPWTLVDSTSAGVHSGTDPSVRRNVEYFYRVIAAGPGGRTRALSITGPVQAASQWLNHGRAGVLVFMVMFFAFVIYYILSAQSGRKLFVRRIPGIGAIEEAIGRAAEMGRPVLYIPGIVGIDDIQTIAALDILESVARMAARHDTPITVPVACPIPFTIAEERVRRGHSHAGRTDEYDPDSVRSVPPEPFAGVAAVSGIMTRDRPAAHIYMGSFFADSLVLVESGLSTGAIQIAGTANVHQLPFFLVGCDHTLIGEELYAASACLSGEPRLLGSLKGADLIKIIIIAVVIVGCVVESMGHHGLTRWMATR
jgi:hypothetical protein